MIRDFKFLQDNDDEELLSEMVEDGHNGASWIFGRMEHLDQYRYEIVIDNYQGIHSLLNNFPSGFIVTIISITGPNGRVHNDNTHYDDGWGFDITGDLLRIAWARFIP